MGTLHPSKRRVFIDTEFTNLDSPALVSLALVAEDGHEFYVELTDYLVENCTDFVRTIVIPQLGQYPNRVMSSPDAARELSGWMNELRQRREKPVLCYGHPIDIELLVRLLGRRPKGWQFQNVSARLDVSKRDRYLEQSGSHHHALFDARANCTSFR
ncbi:3'-5' exoribonuclease [Burkholderia ubonensis]|uniref:3'-5' exoribonuclease n=1 Tax=Burkholderia ubonensis TaxID=101571 RepID=UPI0009B3C934|nr:3'-5' exoribonuclease [Burkholderia ubonensis]